MDEKTCAFLTVRPWPQSSSLQHCAFKEFHLSFHGKVISPAVLDPDCLFIYRLLNVCSAQGVPLLLFSDLAWKNQDICVIRAISLKYCVAKVKFEHVGFGFWTQMFESECCQHLLEMVRMMRWWCPSVPFFFWAVIPAQPRPEFSSLIIYTCII